MPRSVIVLLICICSAGCAKMSKFYSREYVLYDGSADSRPTSNPTTATQPTTPVDRAFALEAELDELDRAIRDGLDDDGGLAQRRSQIEAELVDLKRELGDEYDAARRRRLEEMTRDR